MRREASEGANSRDGPSTPSKYQLIDLLRRQQQGIEPADDAVALTKKLTPPSSPTTDKRMTHAVTSITPNERGVAQSGSSPKADTNATKQIRKGSIHNQSPSPARARAPFKGYASSPLKSRDDTLDMGTFKLDSIDEIDQNYGSPQLLFGSGSAGQSNRLVSGRSRVQVPQPAPSSPSVSIVRTLPLCGWRRNFVLAQGDPTPPSE